MPSPTPVGSPLTFTNSGRTPEAVVATADGGFVMLLGDTSGTGTSTTYNHSIQLFDGSGVQKTAATPFATQTSALEADAILGRGGSIVVSLQSYSTNEDILQTSFGSVSVVSPDGTVRPVYSFDTPAFNGRIGDGFDLAASETSHDLAVVRTVATARGASRVLDILGSDDVVRATTVIDTNAAWDDGSEVTALADGRYVVSWSEYRFTGAATSSGFRPYDQAFLRAQVVDANGQALGNVVTLAAEVGTTDAARTSSFHVGGSITALSGGGFILDAAVSRYRTSIASSTSTFTSDVHEVVSLWTVDSGGSLQQERTLAVHDAATSQTTTNGSVTSRSASGTYGAVVETTDHNLLHTVTTLDGNARTSTGQFIALDGEALSDPFSISTTAQPANGYSEFSLIPLANRRYLFDEDVQSFSDYTYSETLQVFDYTNLHIPSGGDTTAPAVVFATMGGTVSHTIQTVSGTLGAGDAGLTVILREGAIVLGSAVAGADGAWSASVALRSSGAHVLTASATDAAGNTGTSAALTLTLDGTPNKAMFGATTTSGSTPGGQVYALYDGLLGRAPDPLGLEHWADLFAKGVAPSILAAGFLASAEGQARSGAADDGTFVTQLYNAALHRSPDPGGYDHWVAKLAGGMTRGEVGVGFALSTEHLNSVQPALNQGLFVADKAAADVARLYYAVLDRAPDAGGLQGWTDAIKSGTSLETLTGAFLSAPEVQAKTANLSTSGFVDAIYVNALGRHAESAGLANWVDAIDRGGASRATVTTAIGESPEAQLHHLAQIELGWHLA